MKYVKPVDSFFESHLDPRLSALQQAVMSVPANIWKNLPNLSFTQYEPSSIQESNAILEHQLTLIDSFDTLEEINEHENFLVKYGYSPVFLTLEGAYFETYQSLQSMNEGLMSSIKDFVSMMTEGGSAIGILQFVLDIIGLIPFTWAGVPIDIVANLLNAGISFYRGNYLMGCLNLVACADLSHVFGAIKGILRPFAKLFEPLGKLIWKGDAVAAKAGAMEFKTGALAIDKSAAVSKGPIEMLGNALKSVGSFIASTGLKIIKGILDFIRWSIKKVSFGLIDLPASTTKWIDELALKMTGAGKAATEAGETLLSKDAALIAKTDKTATVAAKAAEDTAKAAGKTADEIAAASKEAIDKIGGVKGFAAEIESEILKSPGFQKVAKNSSPGLQRMYVKSAATEKLIGNILKKDTPEALIGVLKNPEVSAELVKMGWKPGEKALVDAIKAGDSAAISKLFGDIAENPAILSKLEPEVAKTVSIFKEMPEALINGTKKLTAIQADLAKFTGKAAYKGVSGRAFIAFILKQMLKTDCAKAMLSKGPGEALNSVKNMATDKATGILVNTPQINELLSRVIVEDDQEPAAPVVGTQDQVKTAVDKSDATASSVDETSPDVTPEMLEKFKKENPEGYDELIKQNEATLQTQKDMIKATNPKGPCSFDSAAAIAKAGTMIKHKTPYKEGQVVTNLTSEKDWEESGINDQMKATLKLIGEDSDIDPQHPMSKQNPYLQAYFSDVYDSTTGALSPTAENQSRLDEVLDGLVKSGEIHENEKAELKAETIKHWENDTYPAQLDEVETKKNKVDASKTNENIFKIGKLITRR